MSGRVDTATQLSSHIQFFTDQVEKGKVCQDKGSSQNKKPSRPIDTFSPRRLDRHDMKHGASDLAMHFGPELGAHLAFDGVKHFAPHLATGVLKATLELGAFGVGQFVSFAQGIAAIGNANIAGDQQATKRNFVTGFFNALKTGLANPKLSPTKVAAFALGARHRNSLLRTAKTAAQGKVVNPSYAKTLKKMVKSYDDGVTLATAMLKRTKNRSAVLTEINRRFGTIDQLYAAHMQGVR